LMHALEFGMAGPKVLPMILMLGDQHFSDKEYAETLTPWLIRLFQSHDPAIRLGLLDQASHYVPKLDATVLNDKIYPSLSNGFNDNQPAVREATLKSVAAVAPRV